MAVPLKLCILTPCCKDQKWFEEWQIFLEIVNKQLKIVNKQLKTKKKSATAETHFGFTNMGPEIHTFTITAI